MKSKFLALAAAALALTACDAPDVQPPVVPEPTVSADGPGDAVVQYANQDEAMNAAVAEAQSTLPAYLSRLDAGQTAPSDMLKVAFPVEDGGREHIWVGEVRREGDGLAGRLANAPNLLPGLQQLSPVTFDVAQVTDWSYEKDGRMWGNYTTRVMLPALDPAEAAQIAATLSETPIEVTAP